MANNKVSSLFNIILPKPKRSNFNLGRVNRFTADVGWLIPCYVEEVLPNSYKRLDLEGLIQTNATVAPLMGSFKIKVDAFFIPRRLYHQHLDLNNIRPNFSDDFEYHTFDTPCTRNALVSLTNNELSLRSTPFTNTVSRFELSVLDEVTGTLERSTHLQVAPSSLLDYLGMLPVGFTGDQWSVPIKLDGLPFVGYFDIFRNYYANPHDQMVPFRVRNFSSDAFGLPSVSDDYSQDRFVSLSAFDSFIANIVKGSLNNAGGPHSLNVLYQFLTNITFSDKTFYTAQSGSAPIRAYEQYNCPPLYAGQLVSSGIITDSGASTYASDTRDGRHFGLLRRTYMDDYFNSRFLNSFVSYLESSSVVQVNDNTFNITQLRLANRIAKYVDKSIFSDSRFGSWIKAHFGVKTNQKLCIPQFLGSITSNIVFNDIYSSAQTGNGGVTDNEALGSRASLGQGYLKSKGSFVEFEATEPGVVMCLFSIIPYVSYFQGIKKMYLKTNFSDMYTPEMDAVGYDDLQKLELCAVPNYFQVFGDTNSMGTTITSINPDVYNVSIGKHPAWIEYMTSYDECHGMMAQRNQYGYWLLNRPFAPYSYDPVYTGGDTTGAPISLNPSTLDVMEASTYINPDYFNTIFAVDRFTDNFQVQLRFFDKTKQPMSKQILPHL